MNIRNSPNHSSCTNRIRITCISRIVEVINNGSNTAIIISSRSHDSNGSLTNTGISSLSLIVCTGDGRYFIISNCNCLITTCRYISCLIFSRPRNSSSPHRVNSCQESCIGTNTCKSKCSRTIISSCWINNRNIGITNPCNIISVDVSRASDYRYFCFKIYCCSRSTNSSTRSTRNITIE